VGKLDDVFLFTIDDLQTVVDENLAERRGEIAACEVIVGEETQKFLAWLRSMDAGPILAALQRKAEQVVLGELEKSRGRLGHLSERDTQLIELLARGVAKRLLREPVIAVKRFAAEGAARHPLEVVEELFDLQSSAAEELEAKDASAAAEPVASGSVEVSR
jgi:glutamyl-tRNA reductase